jgi:hypothetical protein
VTVETKSPRTECRDLQQAVRVMGSWHGVGRTGVAAGIAAKEPVIFNPAVLVPGD